VLDDDPPILPPPTNKTSSGTKCLRWSPMLYGTGLNNWRLWGLSWKGFAFMVGRYISQSFGKRV
jgi:hypothetical protein